MKETKLILFDLDDTLYDFSGCWEKGMKAAIRLHPATCGFETDSFYQRLKEFSDSLWHLIEEQKLTFDEYRYLRMAKTFESFAQKLERETASDFQKLFSVKVKESIEPAAETVALLEKWSQSVQLGIVTNGPADMTSHKLSRLGLDHLFPSETVYISEIIGFHKPDRRIFQHVLGSYGKAPHEALFVGDTWDADIVGAIEAGIPAVWLNPAKREPMTDHQPLAIIESLKELDAVLRL